MRHVYENETAVIVEAYESSTTTGSRGRVEEGNCGILPRMLLYLSELDATTSLHIEKTPSQYSANVMLLLLAAVILISPWNFATPLALVITCHSPDVA